MERGREGGLDANAAEDSARGRVTYKMANLRGLNVRTGNRKKQIMKQTAAPKLQAAKMSIRSHRDTRSTCS